MQPSSCAKSIRLGGGAVCHDPCFALVLPENSRPATPCTFCAHTRVSYTQEEKLPLHHAAAKGAPSEGMELLLDANREATTSRDKARTLKPSRAVLRAVLPLVPCFIFSKIPAPSLSLLALLRRMAGCHYTMP